MVTQILEQSKEVKALGNMKLMNLMWDYWDKIQAAGEYEIVESEEYFDKTRRQVNLFHKVPVEGVRTFQLIILKPKSGDNNYFRMLQMNLSLKTIVQIDEVVFQLFSNKESKLHWSKLINQVDEIHVLALEDYIEDLVVKTV